jgi:hypothetical protein
LKDDLEITTRNAKVFAAHGGNIPSGKYDLAGIRFNQSHYASS